MLVHITRACSCTSSRGYYFLSMLTLFYLILASRLGLAAHYYSWRLMQLVLGLVGLGTFFCILLFFPETYHPGQRGIDKLDPASLPSWRPVIINPLRPLWLLRSPNLIFVVCNFLRLPSHGHLLIHIRRLWPALQYCLRIMVRISSPRTHFTTYSPHCHISSSPDSYSIYYRALS